jgi:exoribonuclease R
MDLFAGRLQTNPRLSCHAGAAARAVRRRHLHSNQASTKRCTATVSGAHRTDRTAAARKAIIRILERRTGSLVGRYDRDDSGMGYVAPFDRRVLMDVFAAGAGRRLARRAGIVELTRWPTANRGAIVLRHRGPRRHQRAGRRHRIIIRKH